MNETRIFLREHARAPITLVLLVALPVLFVLLASNVLGEFADVLGGSLMASAASSLGAGWAAAFIAGSLGFFQIVSSRDADRRLAFSGLGVRRVAAARIGASLILALVAAMAAFITLALNTGIAHPWHAAAALTGFALIYIGVGTLVGALITSPLEGSLAVAFIFLLDVFSGPGMTEGGGSPLSISRSAADVLITAATGGSSEPGEWLSLAIWCTGSVGVAFAVFTFSARSRS